MRNYVDASQGLLDPLKDNKEGLERQHSGTVYALHAADLGRIRIGFSASQMVP